MDEKTASETRARIPFRLRRILEVSAPEATWMSEIRAEAGLDARLRKTWLKRLNSANAHIRQEAMRNFHTLSPAAQLVLTVQAYRHAIERNALVGISTAIIVVAGVGMGVEIGRAPVLMWCLLLSTIVGSIVTTYLHTSRQLELAKNLMDESRDTRLIPFLLIRLAQSRTNNRAPRQVLVGRNLRNALARLLPQVQEADVADWTGIHWRHLLYYLRHPYIDIELTVTILQAMQRVGNEDAAKQMRALTNLSPSLNDKTSIGKSRAAWESNKSLIEQVAMQCLPELEARLEQQRQSQTLLRASGNEVTPSGDILLRPASALVSETPAEQLLRPQSAE